MDFVNGRQFILNFSLSTMTFHEVAINKHLVGHLLLNNIAYVVEKKPNTLIIVKPFMLEYFDKRSQDIVKYEATDQLLKYWP